MNGPQLVEVFESDTLRESLLTIKFLSIIDLNYQVTDVGIGNYYLYEKNQPILVIIDKEHEIWMMYFDGS